ncbi:MAG: hypothetical protein IH886_04405 [Nitrospinae bacterium]|nr:hypothetical protein [Nitrospinota bacterium]
MKTVKIRRGNQVKNNIPPQGLVDQIKKGKLKNSDEISSDGNKWIRLDQHPQLAKYFKSQSIPNTQISDSESKESTIRHESNEVGEFAEEFDGNLKMPHKPEDNYVKPRTTIISILLVCGFMYWAVGGDKAGLSGSSHSSSSDNCSNDGMAYIMSQSFMEKRLKAPSTADFPWMDYTVKQVGSCSFVVKSYVDSQNAFGATVRTHYMMKLKPVSRTSDEWELISVSHH